MAMPDETTQYVLNVVRGILLLPCAAEVRIVLVWALLASETDDNASAQELSAILNVQVSSVMKALQMSLPRLVGLIADRIGMEESSEAARQILDALNNDESEH